MANGALTAALQAQLSQLQAEAMQAENDARQHQTYIDIGARRRDDARKTAEQRRGELQTNTDQYNSADAKRKDFLAQRDKYQSQGDSQDGIVAQRRSSNQTLENERNAKISELKARALRGPTLDTSAGQSGGSANDLVQGQYDSPVKIDPVVATDGSLSPEQQQKASDLLDTYKKVA